DGQVILWEMGNGTKVKGWAAHPATASVKYSQDGRLVTCGRDMAVRVWDGAGAKVKDFEPFTDLALRAVFSFDGSRVIAGDWTGEIRVWSTADGKRVGQLSTNPPSLADRLAVDVKALEEAQANAAKLAPAQKAAAEAADKAAKALAEVDPKLAAAAAKVAETDAALAAKTQGLKSAEAGLAARQNDASEKAKADKAAAAALQKAKDELKKAQDDPKAVEAKTAEVAKLTETAAKAKAE